jgi:DNA-binding FadR family transcriptional regulator
MTTKRPTRSELALDRIRALLDGAAEQTEWRLPAERALAAETGTGRRAVRCALDVLEAEGRLWRHQGKGTFAGRRSDSSLHEANSLAERTSPLEAMEARLEIEPGLARLAATKGPAAAVESMRRFLRTLSASEDAESMERWDGALHRVIAESAGNRLLIALFDVLNRIRLTPSWRRPRALARNADRLRTTQAQHAAIVEAIAARDGAAAERAMRIHLLTLQSNLQQTLLGLGAAPERHRHL